MAVDIVAVGAEPMTWAVFCEECDSYIEDATTNVFLADTICAQHEKAHLTESI